MIATLGTILDRTGVGTLGVLDAQVTVPVLAGPQAQGDLIVLPRPAAPPATTPIPAVGVTVVRGEAAGNTHSLHSLDGPVSYWQPDVSGGSSGLDLGMLTVPGGATAYLVHTEEHGANAIAPGTYVIRRQREMAEEIRLVAD